jgi:hypothetical protein
MFRNFPDIAIWLSKSVMGWPHGKCRPPEGGGIIR